MRRLGVIFFLEDTFEMSMSVNAKKEKKKSVFLVRTPYLHANKIQLKKIKWLRQTFWLSEMLEKHAPWVNTK